MRLPFVTTLAVAALVAAPLQAEVSPDDVAQARAIAKELGGRLQAEVKQAVASGGPEAAIEVCHSKAPAIAAELGTKHGWSVGRTSLKIRNPANAPDAWEQAMLEKFAARKAAGEDPKGLEVAEVVQTAAGSELRYMKAIPTAGLCLNCHGAEVPPGVESKLQAYYPEDQARGYQVGDLRGAFTLSRKD